MTCVVTSTWNPFNTAGSWYSMNPEPSESSIATHERAHSHGYASSESEARRSGSSKKRASRAGTRSVSTLSAAQLERKRANDREAQRAIRQRTKDHIDELGRNISELRQSLDASERRTREVEEENSYLRLRLSEAGLSVNAPPPSDATRVAESTRLLAHTPSPLPQPSGPGAGRSTSLSTSRTLSNSNVPPLNTNTSWPNTHPSPYPAGLSHPHAAPGASPSAPAPLGAWRAHDGPQHIAQPGDAKIASHQSPMSYGTSAHSERMHWNAPTPQYQYAVSEPQSTTSQYPPGQYPPSTQQPPVQQQVAYTHQPIHVYPPQPHPAQQSSYAPSQPAPQPEFQNLAVTSPAQYHVPQGTQSFVSTPQYHMAPPQHQGEYAQLPAPQMATAPFQAPQGEQAYPQVSAPYREDTPRGYNLGQYPSG